MEAQVGDTIAHDEQTRFSAARRDWIAVHIDVAQIRAAPRFVAGVYKRRSTQAAGELSPVDLSDDRFRHELYAERDGHGTSHVRQRLRESRVVQEVPGNGNLA